MPASLFTVAPSRDEVMAPAVAGGDGPQSTIGLLPAACRHRKRVADGLVPDIDDARRCNKFFGLVRPGFDDFGARHLPAPWREDFSQDLCVELLEELAGFAPETAAARLGAWLYHRPRSRAANLLRQRSRGHDRPLEPDDELIPGLEEAPLAALLRTEDSALVRQALKELRGRGDRHDYRMLRLHTIDGVTVHDIGKRFGLAPKHVSSHLHRTAAALRPILRRLGAVPDSPR